MIGYMYVLGTLIDTEGFTVNNTDSVSALRVPMACCAQRFKCAL